MDHARQNPPRRSRRDPFRLLLAALLGLLLVATTAGCQSTAARGDRSGGHGDRVAAAAPSTAVSTSATTSAKSGGDGGSTASSDTKVCGTPPCMRFVSRSETKTIAETFGDHPFLSSVAMHVVVSLLCGGILCLLGEGVSVAYVGDAAKHAAAAHECLRVRILPNGHEWHLVDVTASNQSPYCTD